MQKSHSINIYGPIIKPTQIVSLPYKKITSIFCKLELYCRYTTNFTLMKEHKHESGFSIFGTILTITLLAALIIGGVFAYNLAKDKKSTLTAESAKNMINGQIDKTKQDISDAANKAVNDAVTNATNSAVDSAKGTITNSLDSLKK